MSPERAAPVIAIEQVANDHPELLALIQALDAELDPLYPDESQHGYGADKLKRSNVVMFLARLDGLARACGGIEILDSKAEIKRMYVHPETRGMGLAQRLLDAIETFANERSQHTIRLETGIHQPAAIRLYKNAGYQEIPAFEPYKPDPLSLFMEKIIKPNQ